MVKRQTEWEAIILSVKFEHYTPLEQVIGFDAAYKTYELLNEREQVILDLLMAGWRHRDIGDLFGISAESITIALRRMRFKMAQSTLKTILDARIAYREGRI